MFEDYEIIVETQFSIEDWEGYCKKAENSLMLKLINLTMFEMMSSSLRLGWNPDEESLGAFSARTAKEASSDDDILSEIVCDISKDESYRKMLDAYGEAYHRDESNPVMILKDKETGELLDFHHIGLFEMMLVQGIVDLYE